VLPTVWFRNTWAWGNSDYKPRLEDDAHGVIDIFHKEIGQYWLKAEGEPELLFCDNETNTIRLYGHDDVKLYYKDGINDHIVRGAQTVNPKKTGTKAAANYDLTIPAKQSVTLRLRLTRMQKRTLPTLIIYSKPGRMRQIAFITAFSTLLITSIIK